MATYQISGPGGAQYKIEGPDGADPSSIISQITGHPQPHVFDAINGKSVPVGSPEDIAAQSPLSGNSDLKNYGLGIQQGVANIGRGIGQAVGIYSRQDIADKRALDAPLLATKAGKAGSLTGTLGALLPSAFLPGANTVTGAAAYGLLTGAAMPSTSTSETLKNIGYGGLAGAGGVAAARGIGMVGRGIAGLAEPFSAGGQARILNRSLRGFAGSPEEAASARQALSQPVNALPGVNPTTAELANSPGLAQLDRTLRSTPEFANQMARVSQQNRAAMVNALSDIAGTPQEMAATVASRKAMTDPIYARAVSQQVKSNPELEDMLSRGSMQDAWKRAARLASEKNQILVSGVNSPAKTVSSPILSDSGSPFTSEVPAQSQTIPVGTLQKLKMGLDDVVRNLAGKPGGIGSHELNAVEQTRSDFSRWIQNNAPALHQADQAFALHSQPINQMQIGQALYKKLVPALARYGDDTATHADAFAKALQDGDAMAANVTGNPRATLGDVLSPEQMKTVNQIGEQLARISKASKLGAARGSPTAQNLASQNLLRRVFGPTGMPKSWSEGIAQSTIGQTVLKPYQIVAGAAEPRITGLLQDALRDPQQGLLALQNAQKVSRLSSGMARSRGLLGVAPQALLYAHGQ